MSLEVCLTAVRKTTVYDSNITHNLDGMAKACGLYLPLWRPEEIGVTKAEHLIPLLEAGLFKLRNNEVEMRKHDAPNGCGRYEDFVQFVEQYRAACRENPDAEVSVRR